MVFLISGDQYHQGSIDIVLGQHKVIFKWTKGLDIERKTSLRARSQLLTQVANQITDSFYVSRTGPREKDPPPRQ